jgi:Skp family chaperone for outer membrane proteins
MESWIAVFVTVAAVAIVIQAAILFVLYKQLRRTSERTARIAEDLHARINPVLSRLQVLLEDTQPRISSMVADAAEVTHLARSQAQKVDRVFTEAVDRLRLQLIHADQILTGALESVEEAGSKVRRTILGPVQQAAALVKGVKVGLEFFRSGRRPSERGGDQQDEGLFI